MSHHPQHYAKQKGYVHAPVRPPEPSADPAMCIRIALGGDAEEMQTFITGHLDLINSKDERGNVALHVAASKGYRHMAEILIRYGANIDTQDIFGNSPLLYAIDKGRVEMAQTLIRHGASVNQADYRGNTPLHSACAVNNLEIVEMLIKQGADLEMLDFANKHPAERSTSRPIHLAIERAIRANMDEGESVTQKSINWMGFGIGLGVGLGMALARQQQMYYEKNKAEEEQKKAEEQRKRDEMNARLKGGRKAATEAPTRRLL